MVRSGRVCALDSFAGSSQFPGATPGCEQFERRFPAAPAAALSPSRSRWRVDEVMEPKP